MKRPLFKLAFPILALPRAAKRFVALSVDLGLCVLTVWLAFYLRLGEFVALSGTALWAVAASVGIALPIFVVSGLYRAIFRYTGFAAMVTTMKAIAAYGVLFFCYVVFVGNPGVPGLAYVDVDHARAAARGQEQAQALGKRRDIFAAHPTRDAGGLCGKERFAEDSFDGLYAREIEGDVALQVA